MAKKGTHGYFEDENKDTSFDDFKTDMTNIDDEVDRILAEQRKAKQQIDFFSDDPIDNNEDEYVFDNSSSRELKSNSPRRNTYAENIETEETQSNSTEPESYGSSATASDNSGESRSSRSSGNRASGSKSSGKKSKDKKKKSKKKNSGRSHNSHDSHSSHNSHENKRDNKSSNRKAEKSSKKSDKNNGHSEKKKHTGLKAFIVIIIILGALCGGVYAYFGHIPTKEDIQSILPISNSAEPTSSTSIHETLVAITVSGDTVTYNGEVLGSVDELDSKLSGETDPTISLINNDANATTYNKVVNIVNNYGGNFELMDEDNTNPSINTEENSTENSTENTTESVAESTTEPTSESTSSAE